LRSTSKFTLWLIKAVIFLLVLIVGIIDYVTGVEISFSIFYLFPVFLASWFLNIRTGIAISAGSAILWFLADILGGHTYTHTFIPFWNTMARLVIFISFTIIISRLKIAFDERAKLIDKLKMNLEEIRQAQEELKRKSQELVHSNVELEQFAHVVAHDLKNPLLGAEAYSYRLKKHFEGKLDADAEKYVGYILDGITRMRELIEDLLAYAKLGNNVEELESSNSNDMLNRALANLRVAIEESGAFVTHDKLPMVMVDETKLIQLFQNLIGNAIKYRREEPVRIHVSAEKKGAEWQFSVSDNGIGIDPKDTESIFEIFHRSKEGSDHPGTGIGLAICKRIVELHRGRIWVESEVGKGSTFFFKIPIVPERDKEKTTDAAED
jgi:light-regulated signal transduction histidine kinase (bacteriophytochrome)